MDRETPPARLLQLSHFKYGWLNKYSIKNAAPKRGIKIPSKNVGDNCQTSRQKVQFYLLSPQILFAFPHGNYLAGMKINKLIQKCIGIFTFLERCPCILMFCEYWTLLKCQLTVVYDTNQSEWWYTCPHPNFLVSYFWDPLIIKTGCLQIREHETLEDTGPL